MGAYCSQAILTVKIGACMVPFCLECAIQEPLSEKMSYGSGYCICCVGVWDFDSVRCSGWEVGL